MQIIDRLEKINGVLKGCCLTIGNFDGIHLGHRKIISAARQKAGESGGYPVAVATFDPHPVAILHPEKTLQVLTPLPLKKAMLEAEGVDCLVVLKDSYRLLTLSPADFVEDFMVKTIGPKAVIEGDDFHFGYGRSGNPTILRRLGERHDFDVVIVESEKINIGGDLVRVSSTLVRHLLQAGKPADAAKVLGRPYRLMGKVIKGRGKGAELGFPTANIDPHDQIMPAEGVYAGFVSIADTAEQLCAANQKIPAAFSLGRAKTFISDHPLLIEAHVFDDSIEDLYDKFLAMDFIDFVRCQQRFETEEKLKQQIAKDCQTVKEILCGK